MRARVLTAWVVLSGCSGLAPVLLDAGVVDAGERPMRPTGVPVDGLPTVLHASATVGDRPVELYFPAGDFDAAATRLLVLNDGQDVGALGLAGSLAAFWQAGGPPFVVLAAPAQNRLQDYGTVENGVSIACIPDVGAVALGTLAGDYARWVSTQLVPWARAAFSLPSSVAHTGLLGASLGGLSAVSIAWDTPSVFGFAGAMSGSFWWRTTPGTVEDRQNSRIMQTIVTRSAARPALSLWFEAGTNDETSDRNGNGVIDAIEDTKDLMTAATGKVQGQVYEEVPGGIHGYPTWHAVLPHFLTWAAGL